MSLFDSGIRPTVDAWLLSKAEEKRDYGNYWSASQAGYCMRKVVMERLLIPHVKEDARKQRVFTAGDLFHEWLQRITKESGLSISQELELQDEDLMVRGHIDDLVLVKQMMTVSSSDVEMTADNPGMLKQLEYAPPKLILYDYKSQNSRAFSYQKNRDMSYFHMMQLGTYMYMLRKRHSAENILWMGDDPGLVKMIDLLANLSEARILKISKDDLRMSEQELLWTPELDKVIVEWWTHLNALYNARMWPRCTCSEREGGFMAREAYNPYFYANEPCSLKWAAKYPELTKGWEDALPSV